MKSLFSILLLLIFHYVNAQSNPASLQDFHIKWRAFEKPPLYNGAPDYRQQTFNERMPSFNLLKEELNAIDTTGWSISDKVDWMILWAEMNGFDFNYRVLKPWERDPAFYKTVWTYQSDVPGHEGPTHHATLELWQYNFPLSTSDKLKLIKELKVIPSLNEQAKYNLTGNSKELWIAGIAHISEQSDDLALLLERESVKGDKNLEKAIKEAQDATENFVFWLQQESLSKSGPSGIGKENYTWYQQNVHLVPLTWDDEVMILKRELARAWASLKLEEHRNRKLPPLPLVKTSEDFAALADRSAKSLLTFLSEEEIVTVKDYFEPALRAQLGDFIPEEKRNFFTITMHYDPRPLYSHFYHWFELAREQYEPKANAIRQGPLLYNIFDSRNEGTATAVEEMFMQAGLYDDDPRVREIVYIMIAQRAARGLGSLYAQANIMTMEEAGGIHAEYTPRGWMKTEKELLIFEQHLYMRQPGYGTSYITGKYLLEDTMAELARMQETSDEPFLVRNFFDQLNAIGSIPIALGKWEMTGLSDIHHVLNSK